MENTKSCLKNASTVTVQMDNTKKRFIVMIYLTIFMAAFGLQMSMFGTLQPNIIDYYKLNLQKASFFMMAQNLGTIISMIITALIVDSLNKNRLIGIMILLMGLSFIIMGSAPLFTILLTVWMLLGIVSSMANNTCSAYVSDLYGPERSRYLAILHSFFGIGSLLGPAYAAWMLRNNHGWNGSYSFFGNAALIVGILFFSTMYITKEPVPLVINTDKNGSKKRLPFHRLLANKNMLALSIISICVSGFQLLPAWLPTYLNMQDSAYFTMDRCSVIMTLFYVGMVLSRLSYSYLSKRLPPHKYVKESSIASIFVLIPTLLINVSWLWYAGLLALGLISGALYTAQHALACEEYPEHSASAMSVITLSTALGSIIINSLIGYIADLGYFTMAMLIPVLAIGAASIIISTVYTPTEENHI